jgi:hypothetical protein
MMLVMVKNNSHVVRKPAGSQTDAKPSGRAARPTMQMDPDAQQALAEGTRAEAASADDDGEVESIEIEVDDTPLPEAKPRLAHTVRRPK